MGRKKSDISELDVAQKAKTSFALALNALIEERGNVKELTEYLGFSPQAISQYRNGQTRPSLESICKIADFYDVSVDYLLGRNSVPSKDYNVQKVNDYTGLTQKAISELCTMKALNDRDANTDILSLMLESDEFRYIIGLFSMVISEKIQKAPTPTAEFDFRNIPNESIYLSMMNICMAELAERIAARFNERYHESPVERRIRWENMQRIVYEQKRKPVPSSDEIIAGIRAYSEAVEKRKKEGYNGID